MFTASPGTVFLHVDGILQRRLGRGEKITGAVEVIKVRHDKLITELKTTVTRDDGWLPLRERRSVTRQSAASLPHFFLCSSDSFG
jgi:hypothetical protein